MSEERDRVLTEAMGECWHEYDLSRPVFTCRGGGFVCRKCKDFIVGNNCFSTEDDFAKLWDWAAAATICPEAFADCAAAQRGGKPETTRGRNAFADRLYMILSPKTTGNSKP